MKKYLPYIVAGLLLLVICLVLFAGKNGRTLDKRTTFNQRHKIPYGTYVAHEMLPEMFPAMKVESNKKSPTDWFDTDGEQEKKEGTLFMSITPNFNPTEEELLLLNRFVSEGNQVFISSPKFDQAALDFFDLSLSYNYSIYGQYKDSVVTNLGSPLSRTDTSYFYPGYSYSIYFIGLDTTKFQVLGRTESGQPNFIRANVGKGSFYLHSDPFFFSNYFLLYRNNKDYYEKSLSAIAPSTKRAVWDEYYLYKKEEQENNSKETPSPLRVLFSVQAFKWAFIMAIILGILYILLNMKRGQRIIPVVKKPKNESLDFVKVIGRLYFDKKDHHNLAMKMATYFLEHVRTRYFINTSKLNDEFVKKLSGKSGYDEQEVQRIMESILYIQVGAIITEEQLIAYYKQFQKFYKHIG